MVGVTPGRGGQLWVRSEWVFGVGGMGGVGGVEGGVEADGVVGVAGEGAQCVVVGVGECVADCVGRG